MIIYWQENLQRFQALAQTPCVITNAEQIQEVLKSEYSPPVLLKKYTQSTTRTKSYLLNAQSKEFGDAPKFNETVKQATKYCNLIFPYWSNSP